MIVARIVLLAFGFAGWLALAFALTLIRLLIDEDVNSLNWTRPGGPGPWVTAWIIGSSALFAAVPVAGIGWLLLRVTS